MLSLSEQFMASILSKAITSTLGETLLQETSFPTSPTVSRHRRDKGGLHTRFSRFYSHWA
ncbi:hypothetical protein DPMN_010889 [Dreissena polymorpha]|uniref:Uncharacterized protein n=1 Tax=Dreissena polymorpha TaxID=45954 RepID=A0A9D4RZQ0_DREPO|nr:hypothetical protein DPMN_010889 [Dreissena polymorpha]